MAKLFFTFIIFNFLMGYARAQTSTSSVKIGNMPALDKKTNERSLDNNIIKSFEGPILPKDYFLGPGDELGISIIMGENLTLPLRVTPTGDIFIPSVGLVNVSGFSLDSAKTKIKKFIIQNAFPNAKVNIALLNTRKFQIQVNGAVSNPGFIEISAMDRLGKIISLANGFHPLAKEFDIKVIRKNGVIQNINFLEFLSEGKLSENPTFLEGDKILVPYGDLNLNSVLLRGHIENGGYDLIEDGENLQNFLNRSINLIKESSLNNIIISRKKNGEDEIYYVKPNQFSNFVLLSGDIIDVPRQDRIMVNGYVKNPGAYAFIPGHSAYNYITKAGGTTSDGSVNKVKIVRSNGEIINDFDAILERGDVIIIERSTTNALFGNLSLLQLITSILTIYMTYLSTSN